MNYSSNEHIEHRTMKEKTLQYMLKKLKTNIIECDSEHYIKRGKDSWMKADLYIETDNSIIIIEIKTHGNRQGLLQLLHQSRNINTNKKVILILACNRLGKTELRNFAEKVEIEELKKFKCLVYDKSFNISYAINDLTKYKAKLDIA